MAFRCIFIAVCIVCFLSPVTLFWSFVDYWPADFAGNPQTLEEILASINVAGNAVSGSGPVPSPGPASGSGSGSVSGPAPGSASGSGSGSGTVVVGGPVMGNTGQNGPTVQMGLNTGMGLQPHVQPFCSEYERRTLFNNCAMSFGLAHRRYFPYLASQHTCRAEVFDCGVTDTFVRCVNSQPVSAVSNRCWLMVRDVLTSFLRSYNLPCAFDAIYKQCERRSQDILPIEQRPIAGLGVDNNPFSFILPIVRQYVPLITLMISQGGGLGAMLGL